MAGAVEHGTPGFDRPPPAGRFSRTGPRQPRSNLPAPSRGIATCQEPEGCHVVEPDPASGTGQPRPLRVAASILSTAVDPDERSRPGAVDRVRQRGESAACPRDDPAEGNRSASLAWRRTRPAHPTTPDGEHAAFDCGRCTRTHSRRAREPSPAGFACLGIGNAGGSARDGRASPGLHHGAVARDRDSFRARTCTPRDARGSDACVEGIECGIGPQPRRNDLWQAAGGGPGQRVPPAPHRRGTFRSQLAEAHECRSRLHSRKRSRHPAGAAGQRSQERAARPELHGPSRSHRRLKRCACGQPLRLHSDHFQRYRYDGFRTRRRSGTDPFHSDLSALFFRVGNSRPRRPRSRYRRHVPGRLVCGAHQRDVGAKSLRPRQSRRPGVPVCGRTPSGGSHRGRGSRRQV